MATTTQLLARLRSDIDDVAEPRLWSDAELLENLNRAVDEACLRARLIRDSNTPEVCEIRLRPNIARYDIHKSILGIDRARIPGYEPLEPIVAELLDDEHPRWEDQTRERPSHVVMNMDASWITFYPIPTVVNVVKLTVWRKPTMPLLLEQPERSPEIPEIHHWNLLHWAMHLCYAKHDAEAHDPDASIRCANMFADAFGHRRSAEVMEVMRKTPNLKVKAHFR